MPTGSVQFFRAWIRDPLRVAAVTPPNAARARMEPGPGAGAITGAPPGRGIAPVRSAPVGPGPEFVPLLSARFPDPSILDRLGQRAARTGFAVATIPPATVYRLTRRGSASYRHPTGER